MSRKHWLGLASLVLLAALWGCQGAHQETTQQASLESYDLRAQTFHAGRFDALIDREHRKESELIIIGGRPLHQSIPDIGKTIMGKPEEPARRTIPRPKGGQLQTSASGVMMPLPLKHTDVKAKLALHVGSVTLTQQYHNPYESKIEAVYVFPLPDDAAVRDFVMKIGDRQIRGIIREREEAQRIYLDARRQGHVASLLTQDRPNIFTQSVANIEPGKAIDISITYFHTLRYADGSFEFAFPMVVGPRFNPPGFKDGVGAVAAGKTGASGQKTEVQYFPPDVITAHDIAFEVDIDAGSAMEDPKSPTHVIEVERAGPSRAKVRLSPNDRIPNSDFVLRYKVAGQKIRPALAVHRDESGGYFALMIHPPEKLADVPRTPREMIFVLDCSGSMSGEPLAAAKRTMERCLKRLSPDDTFQIVRFSDQASSMGPVPTPATPENIAKGVRYMQGLNSEGGTMMIEGIKAALDAPGTGRFRVVSFMTDGYIGNDREIIGEVHRRLGQARVFSFGVGSSVNRYLLEGMARVGRGVCAYVLYGDASERAANELYERVERPALTDLQIDWGAMGASEVHPDRLPDLYVGRPIVLVGRFKGQGSATVRLRGLINREVYETAITVNLDEPGLTHAAMPAIWARGKIAGFYDQMTWSNDSVEFSQEIRRVALQYGLMSHFTAFVAVDSLTRTAGESGTTVIQPAPVPKGVKYETTVERK